MILSLLDRYLNRSGDRWIQTYTGRAVDPLRLTPEDISIIDIAHALANSGRFTGHSKSFYSIAEHSVHVSNLVAPVYSLRALLHDSFEAYMPDLAAPTKRHSVLGWIYRQYEARGLRAICDAFLVPSDEHRTIKQADLLMLATEQRDLMSSAPKNWRLNVEPLEDFSIQQPMTPTQAETAFLNRFAQLYAEHKPYGIYSRRIA